MPEQHLATPSRTLVYYQPQCSAPSERRSWILYASNDLRMEKHNQRCDLRFEIRSKAKCAPIDSAGRSWCLRIHLQYRKLERRFELLGCVQSNLPGTLSGQKAAFDASATALVSSNPIRMSSCLMMTASNAEEPSAADSLTTLC